MSSELQQALIDCGFIPAVVQTETGMNMPTYPLTPEQAKAWFISHGVCITEWCKSLGLDHGAVTDLLRGKSKGTRGESHRAAVLLGLKKDPNKKAKAA
jgi:gp16 family phage-associated protein